MIVLACSMVQNICQGREEREISVTFLQRELKSVESSKGQKEENEKASEEEKVELTIYIKKA